MTDSNVKQKLTELFSQQLVFINQNVLELLQQNLNPQTYEIFKTPVAEDHNVEATYKRFYQEKIKEPMAIQNIINKMAQQKYVLIGQLFKDLYQIVNNSYIYNLKNPTYEKTEKTYIQKCTNELLLVINNILYDIMPDTQNYVQETNFDQVFDILRHIKTPEKLVSDAKQRPLFIDNPIQIVEEIRQVLMTLQEGDKDLAIQAIRNIIKDDSEPIQLGKYINLLPDVLSELRNLPKGEQKMK